MKQCNVCGEWIGEPGMLFSDEYAILSSTWGYMSEKDGEEHKCIMCEKCYDRIVAFIQSLGGDVRVQNYLFDGSTEWKKLSDYRQENE